MRSQTHPICAVIVAAAVIPPPRKRRSTIPRVRSLPIRRSGLFQGEAQLRKEVRVPRDEPARLINHGHVLAKTGRMAEAAKRFEKAMRAEEVELILSWIARGLISTRQPRSKSKRQPELSTEL